MVLQLPDHIAAGDEEIDDICLRMQRTSTGRSALSTGTQSQSAKESKERKFSGSTSKGLLTEDQREFSSTLRPANNRTPRSYSANNNVHGSLNINFMKNSSATSKSSNVDNSPMTQQTFSSELMFGVAKPASKVDASPILEGPEDV